MPPKKKKMVGKKVAKKRVAKTGKVVKSTGDMCDVCHTGVTPVDRCTPFCCRANMPQHVFHTTCARRVIDQWDSYKCPVCNSQAQSFVPKRKARDENQTEFGFSGIGFRDEQRPSGRVQKRDRDDRDCAGQQLTRQVRFVDEEPYSVPLAVLGEVPGMGSGPDRNQKWTGQFTHGIYTDSGLLLPHALPDGYQKDKMLWEDRYWWMVEQEERAEEEGQDRSTTRRNIDQWKKANPRPCAADYGEERDPDEYIYYLPDSD
jgi:hypothetical protein